MIAVINLITMLHWASSNYGGYRSLHRHRRNCCLQLGLKVICCKRAANYSNSPPLRDILGALMWYHNAQREKQYERIRDNQEAAQHWKYDGAAAHTQAD